MSKWKDYGFPELTGVPFLVAVEGLLLALAERSKILGPEVERWAEQYLDSFYNSDVIRFYERTFYCVDYLLNNTFSYGYTHRFYLPDGNVFSLENAAAYLKEELITPVHLRNFSKEPFPFVNYDWLAQRYRIVNLLFFVEASEVDTSLELTRSISFGEGATLADAIKDLQTREETPDWYRSVAEIQTIRHANIPWYYISRTIQLPKSYSYKLYHPGRIKFYSTSYRPQGSDFDPADDPESVEITGDSFTKRYFDNFGSDIKLKDKQLLFEIPPDDTIKNGSVIQLGYFDKLRELVQKAPYIEPPTGYGYAMLRRGFTSYYRIGFDFRETLEFYDNVDPVL